MKPAEEQHKIRQFGFNWFCLLNTSHCSPCHTACMCSVCFLSLLLYVLQPIHTFSSRSAVREFRGYISSSSESSLYSYIKLHRHAIKFNLFDKYHRQQFGEHLETLQSSSSLSRVCARWLCTIRNMCRIFVINLIAVCSLDSDAHDSMLSPTHRSLLFSLHHVWWFSKNTLFALLRRHRYRHRSFGVCATICWCELREEKKSFFFFVKQTVATVWCDIKMSNLIKARTQELSTSQKKTSSKGEESSTLSHDDVKSLEIIFYLAKKQEVEKSYQRERKLSRSL